MKVQPADGTAITTTISCSAQGYPHLTITWMHNDMPVLDAPDKYVVQPPAGNTAATLTSTLTIMELNSTDNGMLTCTASIRGCDPLASDVSCYSETFPVPADSKISILSKLCQALCIITTSTLILSCCYLPAFFLWQQMNLSMKL